MTLTYQDSVEAGTGQYRAAFVTCAVRAAGSQGQRLPDAGGLRSRGASMLDDDYYEAGSADEPCAANRSGRQTR